MTIRSVKYLNESEFDIKKQPPQKHAENNEKLTSEPKEVKVLIESIQAGAQNIFGLLFSFYTEINIFQPVSNWYDFCTPPQSVKLNFKDINHVL